MKRWHEDYFVSRREWRKHWLNHIESNVNFSNRPGRIGVSAYVVDCPCDTQIGRFRKKDAWDCGIPQCWVCHSDKFPKRCKHEHEIRSDLSYREQVKEVEENGRFCRFPQVGRSLGKPNDRCGGID